MQNKRLLIVCNNLHIGGIQRALTNMLYEISDNYDVTLFLFYPNGEYSIPENVKLIRGNRFTEILGMSQYEARQSGLLTYMWRGACVIATRLFGCGIVFNLLCKFQKLKEEYDVAISYMQNSDFKFFYGGCNEFVINSVKSKRKISFLHCDFKNYYGNNDYNRGYYKNFDLIACVSDSCKKVFDLCCPEYSDKTVAIHNFCNFDEITAKSNAFDVKKASDRINILTSARISEEKGVLRMIPIFARLKENGIKFLWNVLGDGPDMDALNKLCQKYDLKDDIKIWGLRPNPYPFFKNADLLLVPSYNEAAPMVYNEASVFGIPVLSTNTTSAIEMIKDTGMGVVCENTDESIYEALKSILDGKITLALYEPDLNNNKAKTEFEKIME